MDRLKRIVSAGSPSILFVYLVGLAAGASAQTVSSGASGTTATDKWEFEVHAGGVFGGAPTGGTAISTFPVGDSFIALSGPDMQVTDMVEEAY